MIIAECALQRNTERQPEKKHMATSLAGDDKSTNNRKWGSSCSRRETMRVESVSYEGCSDIWVRLQVEIEEGDAEDVTEVAPPSRPYL